MFGRATIRLGIGPHSSCITFSGVIPGQADAKRKSVGTTGAGLFMGRMPFLLPNQ